jgi:hypothetical protein
MTLNKDQILQASDIPIHEVEVPEWGGSVFVKGMTGTERDKFESSIIEMRGNQQRVNMIDVRAKLACYTICDEKGKRLFTDVEIKELAKKSASALQRIFDVAQKLSGIGADDVESLLKNSESAPAEDSTSG